MSKTIPKDRDPKTNTNDNSNYQNQNPQMRHNDRNTKRKIPKIKIQKQNKIQQQQNPIMKYKDCEPMLKSQRNIRNEKTLYKTNIQI